VLDGSLNVIKSADPEPLHILAKGHLSGHIGMGHNRWATHGGNTYENTHPHLSNDRSWAIVHNGIIENYEELKTILSGYTFYSQTDSEVICNLLQYNYNGNVYNAIQKTIHMLRGSYALIILTTYEEKMYCVKQQSPLLVGYDGDKVIVTSEKSGFCYDVKYIILKENDICVIDRDIMTNYTYPEYDHTAGKEATHTYPHWTLKEIHEQPEAVLRIQQQRFDLDVDNIIILGCGTSYYAGQYGMHFFKQSRRYTVQAFEGADFTEADIPKGKTAYIFISQSGETIDLYQCLKITRGPTIGIINVEDSLLARELDNVMYCNAGKEVGVASVKSFTNQVVCLALLAGFEVDLAQLSADIQTTIDRAIPVCKKMASTPNLFLIGKGTDEVVAREGALKLKEISYIHAEGYSASSLKHGPFALLDEHMPVILLEMTPASMSNCYHEIKSRNSPIFYITNRVNERADLVIPENKMFASLLGVIPLQLLAYYISVSKGINPDKPKNLAKVVTVL
jgi:glucosamine--fructose-6-phosphate aminotransferase (isomerizing)